MRTCLKIFILLVVLAVSIGGSYYYFYWLRSPEQSINLVKTAIKEHDIYTFEQHVNVDKIAEQSWDVVMEIIGEKDTDNIYFVGMARMLKPTMVPAIKNDIMDYVRSGRPDKNNSHAYNIYNSFDIEAFDFKEIQQTKINGNNATAYLKFYNNKTKQDTILIVSMSKLSDGTWRIDSINSLKGFMEQNRILK